ncbi:putative very-long-chain 3-oxoacyl-CoA reductase [Rosa chinensis]|uniref:Putative very-long-chain 3-oxoacyl-CoA reductase n=1 Tax=Rosa chinensis TaxID=74649 RepID=A0A2P6RG88_ROSCH|nr:putative very-long-chain 3-oxoacyl-CoA reductase [Rosa chinensis]
MELDLSSLSSVRKFASDYKSSGRPLNILINNAGIMATPFLLSKDKIELQFATNHIGMLHLTARSSSKEGRIVNASSEAHRYAYREGIRFDRINDPSGYSSWPEYGQSKLANILHAKELSKQIKEDGANITANALHPGVIPTNLFHHNIVINGNHVINGLVNVLGRVVLKNVQQGAATTCYVALHPQAKGVSGEYFSDSIFPSQDCFSKILLDTISLPFNCLIPLIKSLLVYQKQLLDPEFFIFFF